VRFAPLDEGHDHREVGTDDEVWIEIAIGHGKTTMEFKWLPVVAGDRCAGCGRCVEACGPNCLEIAKGIAVLPRPDECGSEEHCITECRDDAIRMEWVRMEGNKAVGVWR